MKLFSGSNSSKGGVEKAKSTASASDFSTDTGNNGNVVSVGSGQRGGGSIVKKMASHIPGARRSARDRLDKHVEKKRWDRLEELFTGVEQAARMCGGGGGEVPEELKDPDEKGRTFLHSLCSEPDCPTSLIESLAKIAPRSVTKRDQNGFTPLHRAILLKRGPRLDVVNALITVDPRCVLRRDSEGRTPIFLACEEIGRYRLIASSNGSLHQRGSAHLRRFVGSAHRRLSAAAAAAGGGGGKSTSGGDGDGASTASGGGEGSKDGTKKRDKCKDEIDRLADAIEYVSRMYPECAVVEDENERTPLDRAASAQAPKRALVALQDAVAAVKAASKTSS